MKDRELRCLLMPFIMFCLLLPSCGGGDGGGGGPEGIFDGPVALVSASPPTGQ